MDKNGIISVKAKIIRAISGNSYITRKELSKKLAVSENTLKENLSKLKKNNLLKRIGPDKGGHWEVKILPSTKDQRL